MRCWTSTRSRPAPFAPRSANFPVNTLLDRLRDEFTDHAQAQGLALHVVDCGLSITSDPRLLEQMVRNLLSNALKYTKTRQGTAGLPPARRQVEHRDLGHRDRHPGERTSRRSSRSIIRSTMPRGSGSAGLGLGLFIVRQLGALLGHKVQVRSQPGKGSVFSIEIDGPLAGNAEAAKRAPRRTPHGFGAGTPARCW